MLDAGAYGMIPMRLTAFDTKQTSEGDTVKMLWCAFSPLNKLFPFVFNEPPENAMNYQFTQAASETGYLFQQNGNNSYAHLTTGEFIITASQDTELVITTYTRQSTNTGEMATFVNDDLLTIQSSIDGIIEKRIALRAHEPVTVFAENFALLPYNSNNGTPTYVLFNADCPLEIIKYDDLPFHRIYRTEDAVKVGSQVGWISGEYSEITTG